MGRIVSPKLLGPNPKCECIWRQGFRRGEEDKIIWVDPHLTSLVSLKEEVRGHRHQEERPREDGEEASGEPNPTDTLILDFQPLQLRENEFLDFKPPACGMVTAAPADKRTPWPSPLPTQVEAAVPLPSAHATAVTHGSVFPYKGGRRPWGCIVQAKGGRGWGITFERPGGVFYTYLPRCKT